MAEEGRLTLRRLEAPIHKFTKVALPTDLERLQHHHGNILRYQRLEAWDRLHQEHINASRTVQQLRSNMREMEKLCGRVRPEDGPALEKLVQPIRDRARAAAQDFLLLHSSSALQPNLPPHSSPSRCQSGGYRSDEGEAQEEAPSSQIQLCLPSIPAAQSAAESWDNLEEDLKQLNCLVTEFSLLVHSQQEQIDRIEDNISEAAINVQEGTKSLGAAAGFRLAVLPVAGALLGGVVGGPIGLLAGFKAAGLAAALGGGALGYASANLVQRQRRARVELQLRQLEGPEPGPNPESDPEHGSGPQTDTQLNTANI